MWRISELAKDLLAPQKDLCSTELRSCWC